MKTIQNITLCICITLALSGCGDKFFNVIDNGQLDAEEAAQAATAHPESLLNGMWSYLGSGGFAVDAYVAPMLTIIPSLMSEDIALSLESQYSEDYRFEQRKATQARTSQLWSSLYAMIGKANEIISFYPNTDDNDVKVIKAQALAIRGWAYWYLIQFFQFTVDANGNNNLTAPGVPLINVPNEGYSNDELNARKGRNSVKDVFEQIEKDLTTAVVYLEEAKYMRPSKLFIDAQVANGLLARYYLLSQQWENAAKTAAKARENYPIMSYDYMIDGFISIDNPEWMWGFKHTTSTSSSYASFHSMMSPYSDYGYGRESVKMIDAKLYSQIDNDDYRKLFWWSPPEGGDIYTVNFTPTAASELPYANHKFGFKEDGTADYLYMRASEMLLIEAEAYARLNQNQKAASIIAELMAERLYGWNKNTVSIDEIYFQRRIELWGEGFAYFDMKRLNKSINRNYENSNHLPGYKIPVPAQDKRWIFQIPEDELQENKHINDKDQNP